MDNEKLIKDYAPLFWFHKNETYFPKDVQLMADISDLYKNNRKVPFNHTLDELGRKREKEYSLALHDVNLGYPDSEKDRIRSPRGFGPYAVSEHIKDLYESKKDSYDNIIYNRSKEVKLERSDFETNIWSGRWKPYNEKLPGDYLIIQYFPYYVYNDFMNKHVGDWDSTVEILINKTQNLTWIRTYMHHYAWFSSMGGANQFTSINYWLRRWQNLKRGDLGPIFNINGHPFIFVSLGGHGCYPTPGYSLYGVEAELPIFKKKLLEWALAIDERQIGKVCLIPEDSNISKNEIKESMSQINQNPLDLKIYHYKLAPADNQPWSDFKGRWGNRSKLKGWDSPDSAPNRAKFKITKNKILKKLQEELKTGYEPGFIFQNSHGLL